MTDKKDITIFGFSRSLELFMISSISFIGLLVIATLMMDSINTIVRSILIFAIGLSGVGTAYFLMRYNAEQEIAFMAANLIKIMEEYNNCEENDEKELTDGTLE